MVTEVSRMGCPGWGKIKGATSGDRKAREALADSTSFFVGGQRAPPTISQEVIISVGEWLPTSLSLTLRAIFSGPFSRYQNFGRLNLAMPAAPHKSA